MEHAQFEMLVHQYSDTIYRVAYQALKNRADAEDVVQTVLLKLFERSASFESPQHIRNWLLHVTVNECRKVLRTPWRKRIFPLEEGPAIITIRMEPVLCSRKRAASTRDFLYSRSVS